MAATELARHGWHLSGEGITRCSEEAKSQRSDVIIKKALDTDIKEIGSKWLPEDINKGRVDCLEGPAVLQVSKLRVVSAPKDNEESQTAPRLCRVSLTDGRTTCFGVTLEVIKGIGPNTPPGSKILLSGPVEVESSFLLLTNKNVKFLGGNVENLAAAWELKKTLAQQTLIRNKMQEGGPPPFVPFGSKINRNEPIPTKKDFKSLASEKDKDPTNEDDKFLQQRQAVIQQALQAKTRNQGAKPSFGGGGQKQMVKDKDVARIIEMGFSAQDATSALKQSGGNVQEAINNLVSGPQHGFGGRFPDRGRPISGPREREGGRGDRRKGARDREQQDDYDEDDYVSRPRGPATLFDFIEAKLLSKEDSKKTDKSSSSVSKQSANLSSSSSSATTTTTTTTTTSSSRTSNHNNSKYATSSGAEEPVFKHNTNDSKKPSGRPNTSQGFSSSEDSYSKYPNRPASNYNQRNGSHNTSRDSGARSTNKGYSESNPAGGGNDGMVDRRQHTTLPPRFAKQRTESSYNRDAEEINDNRPKGHYNSGRQPLSENNDNYNQPGRYNKNYSSAPSHSSDYQGRIRQSHNTSQYNKNKESYSNKPYNSNNPVNDHYNSRKENSSDNTNSSSSAQSYHQQQNRDHGYSSPPNQHHYNQGSDYEASGSDRYHPADRGSYTHPAERGTSYNKYNNRNGMNPNQNYRNQQHHHHQQPQYQEPSYQQPPPQRQSSRAPYNPKPRNDRQFPESDGPYQVGEMVMAKYWEDNKFYRALVMAIGPPGTTVLVRFVDYGNEEDVLLTDVRPIQGQGGHVAGGGGQWGYRQHSSGGGNMSRGQQDFDPMAFADGGHFVPPMQFTRGGQGNYGKGGPPRKPTQSFYQPPSAKH